MIMMIHQALLMIDLSISNSSGRSVVDSHLDADSRISRDRIRTSIINEEIANGYAII